MFNAHKSQNSNMLFASFMGHFLGQMKPSRMLMWQFQYSDPSATSIQTWSSSWSPVVWPSPILGVKETAESFPHDMYSDDAVDGCEILHQLIGGKHPTIYRVSAIPNWFCLGFGWPIHSIIYTCTKDHGVNPQDPTGSTCGLGVCNPTSHVSHLWSFCRSNHRSSWGSIIFLHSWCVCFPWVLPISKLLCWVG